MRLESLRLLDWFHRLVQFFKIQNGFTPTYPKTPVPQCPRNHLFGTRNENDLYSIKCRRNSYLHRFYPHSVNIWNEIGPTLRQVPSLSIFKSNVLKLIRPQKKNVFNIRDPEGMKRLFQSRVGLSPLRYHKKRHNVKDIPSDTCICGMSVETTEHFLIYCNLYNEVRVNLFQVINPILETKHLELPKNGSLVHFLLYGHANLSVELNTQQCLLRQLHIFIDLLVLILINQRLLNLRLIFSGLAIPHPLTPTHCPIPLYLR